MSGNTIGDQKSKRNVGHGESSQKKSPAQTQKSIIKMKVNPDELGKEA